MCIKQAASDAIDKLVAKYPKELNKILVAEQMPALYEALNKIVEDNLDKFNSVGDNVAKGVLTSIPSYFITGAPAQNGLGGLLGSGTDFAENVIKNLQALPTMVSDLEAKIIEIAAGTSKWEMLKTSIKTIFTVGNEAAQLINSLVTQGYTTGNIICSMLDAVDLSKAGLSRDDLQGYKSSLVGACYDIEHLLVANHDYSGFKQDFINQVSDAIVSYQKGIYHALSQAAGTITGNWFTKPISRFFQSKKAQQEALQEQERQERQRIADQIIKKFYQKPLNLYTSVNDDPDTGTGKPSDDNKDPNTAKTPKQPEPEIKSEPAPKPDPKTETPLTKKILDEAGNAYKSPFDFSDTLNEQISKKLDDTCFLFNDKDGESKTQSNDPRILSGKQLASKYLFNGRDMPAYESMYNAKVEIITTDTVDGKNLAWRVVRRLNADKATQQTYSEHSLPLLHVGFSNTDKGDFFGFFKNSQVVDGPSGSDPRSAYQRHSDVILDKGMNADAFLLQHGYNQELLTQARKNIDFSWNAGVNENVKRYFEGGRNCWHYMHAVEQEYVRLGGVLYLKHTKK